MFTTFIFSLFLILQSNSDVTFHTNLFSDIVFPDISHKNKDSSVVRTKYVTVNFELLQSIETRNTEKNTIVLNLFDDVIYNVIFQHTEKRTLNSYTLTGYIDNEPNGHVILSVENDAIMGSIILPGDTTFKISYVEDTVHMISQVKAIKNLPCGAINLPASENNGNFEPNIRSDSIIDTIDVMVVYTTDARIGVGGTDAMIALINLAVAEMNTAFTNSQISAIVRLVHTAEVDYEDLESDASAYTDLDRLTVEDDGYLDEVHPLRDSSAADVVTLFKSKIIGYRGYAWVNSNERFAFNIVRCYDASAPYYIFEHEVGHNLGCGHTRVEGLKGTFDYSYAYWDHNDIPAWRTVVANYGGPPILHFSNPNVYYQGQPTGVDSSIVDSSADNARTINIRAPIVSDFRTKSSGINENPPDDIHFGFSLHQNNPNPFTTSTTISFILPYKTYVRLDIYSIDGRLIRNLVNKPLPQGSHIAVWDGKDKSGKNISSGIYFYRIASDNFIESKKLMLLRTID